MVSYQDVNFKAGRISRKMGEFFRFANMTAADYIRGTEGVITDEAIIGGVEVDIRVNGNVRANVNKKTPKSTLTKVNDYLDTIERDIDDFSANFKAEVEKAKERTRW